MIVRLGDAATDAASAEDAGFLASVVNTQPVDVAVITAPASTTDYTSVTSALDKTLDPSAYSGTLPTGAPTINSSGNVVPSTSSSGASSLGSSISSLFSNLLGGSSTKVAPAGYSYNSAGQLVANTSLLSNSTNTLFLFGAIGIVVLVIMLPGKKR
jgi:hypothetical protein